MKINIIIPTYKPEMYLHDCLLSISKQSLNFSEFSVIIVLNGTEEPYFSQIQQWLNEFDFQSTLLYSEIASVSSARNLALNTSTAKYICFLDDDDIITENYLQQLVSKAYPNSIVVSNVLNFIEDTSNNSKDYLTFDKNFKSTNLLKYRKYLSNSCCKLIPREIIGNNQFNIKLFKGEDALFMFLLSNKITNIISTEPDVIYYRRIRSYSASRKNYSVLNEIKIATQQQWLYTKIYIKNFKKYSFLLYLSRILAVCKFTLKKIKTSHRTMM